MSEFVGDNRSWKETFKRQSDSGKFWKNLHGNEFERQTFLMRSDAHWLCYKAQSNALIELSKRLKKQNVDESVISEIIKLENELWDGPTSVNECEKAF
jgi:hypothetical protein